MKVKILSVGEIIWDVYPEKKVIGGAPLNFAAHCVLRGAKSGLISAVGKDELGERALQGLKEYGVRDFVQEVDIPTGRCVVTLDENKVPNYHIERKVAYDEIQTEKYFDEIKKEQYVACPFESKSKSC